MEKLIKLDVKYVGRFLRPSNGEFHIKFLVSENEDGPWKVVDHIIQNPVDWKDSEGVYSTVDSNDVKPITSEKSEVENNAVYYKTDSRGNHLDGRDLLNNPVLLRVDINQKFYKILADCKKCCKTFIDTEPERIEEIEGEKWFVVGKGSIY